MISDKRPEPGEMSPSEEWENAHDFLRDTHKDDARVMKWLIDLDGPTDQEGELSNVEQRERALRLLLREAQKRVGKSDEDRLRWLLRFTSPTEEQIEGPVEDLQCEIFAFAVPPTAQLVPCDVYALTGELSLYPGELYAWVRSGLHGLKDSIVEGRPFEWNVNAHQSHHFTWLDGRLVDRPLVEDPDLTEDRFKAQVSNVLIRQGHRVRLCQNCTGFFVRRKRQTYCTIKCSNIKRTTKYRGKHPERISEQRRQVYVRKQQRLHGPKVNVRKNVRRRPRRAKP